VSRQEGARSSRGPLTLASRLGRPVLIDELGTLATLFRDAGLVVLEGETLVPTLDGERLGLALTEAGDGGHRLADASIVSPLPQLTAVRTA
jgi:hypothetical protein